MGVARAWLIAWLCVCCVNVAGAEFNMEPGLTACQILDYSLTGHLNLEADIRLPEPEGIVQVETFGLSINSYGTCFYGLQLEAVMDRSVL